MISEWQLLLEYRTRKVDTIEIYYTLYGKNKDGADLQNAKKVCNVLLKKVFGKENFSQISYTEKGKPYIEGETGFSVCHSGEMIAVLIAEGMCGVDAEPVDSMGRRKPLEVLTDDELAWLQDPVLNYMTLWTRKEAALKAFGDMELADPRTFTSLKRSNSITFNGVEKFIGSYFAANHIISWASDKLGIPGLNYINLDDLVNEI